MEQLKSLYQNKKVLVTGGAGFIGSHIAEKLVSLGAQVTILDNFSTGKVSNLKNILTQINLIYSDINLPHVCMKTTQNKDIVFHLAAIVSVPQSQHYPEICLKINSQGTKNMLEGCKKNSVKTFVFSSSCAVYGDKNKPCTEDDAPKPLSPYAQSKLEGEQLCRDYAQNFGINTVSLRYFNVYGERQHLNGEYSAVITKFRHNIQNNLPLTIFGTGQQTRDFIHVNEVVVANLKMAVKENLQGNVFNVASGKSISILDLIKKLESELGKKAVDIKFQPARSGDIVYSQASCEKLKTLIETI
jgi:UDP-glucose 4-epimerase